MSRTSKSLAAFAAAVFIGATVRAADNEKFVVSTNGTTVSVSRNHDYSVSGLWQFTQSFPDGTLVRKLVFDMGDVVEFAFLPEEASALPEGIEVVWGQMRIQRADALGTGPLVLGNSVHPGQFVPYNSGMIDVSNKIVFANASSRILAPGLVNYPTVRALGSGSAEIRPWLGRASGDSRVCLSLSGEGNEALPGIRLSGALQPFEIGDGTLRIGRGAQSPFFSCEGSAADKAASRYLVSADSLTLDAAANADVELGVPLDMANATKTVAVVTPTNGSFEDGETGWTFSQLTGGGSKIGVKENGGASNLGISGTTTSGTKYFVMRCLHRLTGSSAITIPDVGGEWFVGLAAATRNAYYSYKIQVKVRFTSVSDSSVYFENTLPARSGYHNDFAEYEVGPFDLPAGEYYLSLETTKPEEDTDKWSMLAVDNVHVRCIGKVDTALTKMGTGRVALGGANAKDATFAANAGTLALGDSVLDGVSATVANAATLEIAPGVMGGADGLSVSVAAGGTLKLTDISASNLLSNASFEADAITTSYGFEAKSPTGWTMVRLEENTGNGSNSGIQTNGCSVSSGHPTTSAGVKTAYLRQKTRLSQTVNVPESGNYRFSFARARRDYSGNGANYDDFSLKASVGGHEFAAITATSTTFERFSQIVALPAGENTVTFETDGDNAFNGPMFFIDDVRLSKVSPLGELDGISLEMAQGSTLHLDLADEAEVSMPVFSVGGEEVNGRRGAIARAGVTVSGEGNIVVGKVGATVISLR